MPDGYVHVLAARKAAALRGGPVEFPESFKAGANGPDPLFFYRIWALRGGGEMYALSGRLHTEKTGAFLQELLRRALSPACQWYARGFLVHYAVDCVFHPFVYAMTEIEGAPYCIHEGHSFFESALDSYFCQKETGSPCAQRKDTSPHLAPAERTWVASQLRNSIRAVYGVEHPQKVYEDTFRHMWALRGILCSPSGGKKVLAKWVENALFHAPGFVTGHMQPAKPLKALPPTWENVYTGQVEKTDPDALLQRAVELALRYIKAADGYFANSLTLEEAGAVFGNNGYETGVPLKEET